MARYRVRAFLPDRTPVILIINSATDAYDAVSQARAQIVAEGQEHLLPRIDDLGVTEMDPPKRGAVYIGKTPSSVSKRGRPAATPTTATPPAAPAAPAAEKTEPAKGKNTAKA